MAWGLSRSWEHRWNLSKNPQQQSSNSFLFSWLDYHHLHWGCLPFQGTLQHSGGLLHLKVWSQGYHGTKTWLPTQKLSVPLGCHEAEWAPSLCHVTRTPDGSAPHFLRAKETTQSSVKNIRTKASPREITLHICCTNALWSALQQQQVVQKELFVYTL